MSTLMEELTAIKAVEDKLTANKVANFAYTDHAYNNPLTEADGVASYDPDAEQNIPNANASTLQVNSTILTKGWRAQASSITRMLMNHFLGRVSYNLNKINDLFSTLLTKLMTYMGVANGLATLDENGHVPLTQLNLTKSDLGLGNVVNTGDTDEIEEYGTTKFTSGGMYNIISSMGVIGRSSNPYFKKGQYVYYQGSWLLITSDMTGNDWDWSKTRSANMFSESNFSFGLHIFTSTDTYWLNDDKKAMCWIFVNPLNHDVNVQANQDEGLYLNGAVITDTGLERVAGRNFNIPAGKTYLFIGTVIVSNGTPTYTDYLGVAQAFPLFR